MFVIAIHTIFAPRSPAFSNSSFEKDSSSSSASSSDYPDSDSDSDGEDEDMKLRMKCMKCVWRVVDGFPHILRIPHVILMEVALVVAERWEHAQGGKYVQCPSYFGRPERY